MKEALAEDVDPVSGNEIPTGSLPEEVRDDIPAQLSEGEYVVPADVVRYYGVKFFEDLRKEAKLGFNQMEANGRIGGEPIEATGMEMGGDELPFDISELQMVDDAQPEMNKGGYIRGYDEGGLVEGATSVLGQSVSGMEYKTYVNAAGDEITIMFFNGMPMSAIPEGYTDKAAQPAIAEEVAPVKRRDRDPSPVNTPEAINYKELTAAELRDLVEEQKGTKASTITSGMAMLNPIMGIALKAAMWHQSSLINKELERRLEDGQLDEKQKSYYTDLQEVMNADKPGFFEKLFGKKEEPVEEEVVAPEVAGSLEDTSAYSPDLASDSVYTDEIVEKGLSPYVPNTDTSNTPGLDPALDAAEAIFDTAPAMATTSPVVPTTVSEASKDRDRKRKSAFSNAASKADAGTKAVAADARKNLATAKEVRDIKKEGARIKRSLESSARGGQMGFSKGGLASKKKK